MKIESRKVIELFTVSVCAVIGVGFISGAEIVEFFSRFGKFSFIGILVFFELNFALCFKILYNNPNKKFTLKMQNNSKINNKNTNKIKNYLKSIFIFFNLLMLSSAMLAGLKILTKNLFFNNYLWFYFGLLVLIFVVLIFGIKGLSKIDYFVLLFVFIIIIIFAFNFNNNIYNNITIINNENESSIFKFFIMSILFSAMYIFMNIVQIEPLKRESGLTFTKKQAVYFALAFSTFLSVVLLVFVIFLLRHSDLQNYSMPLLAFFENLNNGIYIFYVIGLLLAIITTLLACLIGVKSTIMKICDIKLSVVFDRSKNKKSVCDNKILIDNNSIDYSKGNILSKGINNSRIKNILACALSLVIGLLFSLIGFNNFVSIIYPLIGVLNFIIFVFL